tara:strand:+ start:39 stop:434 length:396 start_codon:yes stop_codon:yes gene_type:complete
MTKLKNVVVLDEKTLKAIANGEKKFDNRKNNTGRPVNKKSNRQQRLAKQAFYNDVNSKFVSGKAFKLNNNSAQEFRYTPSADGDGGCLFNGIGSHECNIDYIGRTKATGYTFVLNKRVKVELNLKTLKFVS